MPRLSLTKEMKRKPQKDIIKEERGLEREEDLERQSEPDLDLDSSWWYVTSVLGI